MCTDPAEHFVTAAIGSTIVDDLDDLDDLGRDLSEGVELAPFTIPRRVRVYHEYIYIYILQNEEQKIRPF